MRRRKLPEECYDFWVEDGRDGEESRVFPTYFEAAHKRSEWRAKLPTYERLVIQVRWQVNEEKVLKLLKAYEGWRKD